MGFRLVECSFCNKNFPRQNGKINEAKKFDWKQFCSPNCLAKSKMSGKILYCSNPKCNKKFYRKLNQFRKSRLNRSFCSCSCAATVNNSKFPKRKAKIIKCNWCNKEFKGGGAKYCSKKCKNKAQTLTRKEIQKKIREFYRINGRIPLKIEFSHYNAAQERFGSWNKAIKAAGFQPNPVMFAKKHIANDGHICDSFAEKIIDDWLYFNNIKHQRNIPYPSSPYTADFLINGKLVEFFGLSGELEEYDKNIKIKEDLAKKYKLNLVKIYPKDLFPKNRLSEIIKI